LFWSSEGYFFMKCSADEVHVMSRALAMHTEWERMMARGLAMVAVEEPGVDEVKAQLEQLLAAKTEGALRLSPDGVDALRAMISETAEVLRGYLGASKGTRSQGIGRYGMLEDYFGEELRDPAAAKRLLAQLDTLTQRTGLEAI